MAVFIIIPIQGKSRTGPGSNGRTMACGYPVFGKTITDSYFSLFGFNVLPEPNLAKSVGFWLKSEKFSLRTDFQYSSGPKVDRF